ncbi:MAG: hypothetical protein ABEK10_00500 [Candidatus Nanosalina sp.]
MNLKSLISRIPERSGISQKQLGEVLIVASSIALVFSAYGAFKLVEVQKNLEDFDDVSASLSRSVNSQEFNDTIEALKDVRTGAISEDMRRAASVLERYQVIENSLRDARNTLEEFLTSLQWLFLISVIGEVSGLTLLYM